MVTKGDRPRHAACLLLSSREAGLKGKYREPTVELGFHAFVTSLLGRAVSVARTQPPEPEAPPRVEEGPAPQELNRGSEPNVAT
jgi:hypothetical protein